MNPSRLESFAAHYATAVLQAVVDLNLHRMGKTPQQYALDVSLSMLNTIQSHGVAAVSHYVINNTRGGAFRHTAEALGLSPTPRALQDYLEGGMT